ncbi:MAG TPA: hypothetical protein VLY87_02955, partial [Flavobacterium sp.]|nr:hypothetical protein [Flavobacterium sp.]
MIKYLLFFLIIPILSFGQQQIGQTINYIEPEDGTARTISISSDGKIVAIGSPYHDANGVKNAGTVRVFRYLGGNWTQIGQSISGMFTDGNFGFALTMSADGKTFATKNHDKFTPNAPIIIKIYRNTLGNWTLIGNIVSPNNSLSFTGASDRSISLSADGNTIAFSDGKLPGNLSRHDRVRVFQNISGVWTQIGQDINSKLTSNAVGIRNLVIHPNGNIVALTEEDEISNNNYASKEYVSVYHLNTSGSWSQLGQDFFTPKDPSRS